MTRAHYDVLIVGAGHAGAQAAIALRQEAFVGTVGIVGAEPELPYERPPLSKEYLAGDRAFARMLIRPAGFWADRGVDFLLGRTVTAVDPVARTVATADGARIAYGQLVWAAGGRPRTLACAGHDLRGVHTVRNRADVDRLLRELPRARTAVVIGGGYIGLEAAATLTKLGKAVTVVETLDRVLARVAGERLSRFFEDEHRARGVRLLLRQTVAGIEGGDAVHGVRLGGGELLPADIVIVGIGIAPAVEPLVAAGAAAGDGVQVDGQCRTGLPGVFAVGDCAAHSNRYAGGATIRLESVQNANDQAMVAARTIVGQDVEYDALPWFWSNQYDLKLQTAGLSAGHDDAVLRGDPAGRSFAMIYLRDGKVIAIDAVNSVRDYVQGRTLVARGASPPRDALADPAVPLKELADP